MKKVEYNSEIFDLVKNLTLINSSIIFEKDEEGNVVVRRSDREQTVAYQLVAPNSYFDFDNEFIAFYEFIEFYNYFKAFTTKPEIYVDDLKLVMKNEGSKTDYLLSNPEVIDKGPKSINFTNPDIKFKINSSDLDEFIRMNGLIKPRKAKIFGNSEKITIKLFNNLHDNTFEKTFNVESFGDIDEEIDFVIFSDTLTYLPIKNDYSIEIKKQGFVKISLLDKNIKLDIYTGKVKEQ
jgi:hypothetical protein